MHTSTSFTPPPPPQTYMCTTTNRIEEGFGTQCRPIGPYQPLEQGARASGSRRMTQHQSHTPSSLLLLSLLSLLLLLLLLLLSLLSLLLFFVVVVVVVVVVVAGLSNCPNWQALKELLLSLLVIWLFIQRLGKRAWAKNSKRRRRRRRRGRGNNRTGKGGQEP